MTFLLIMIALTLLTVFVAVVHPVAWTDDEMRFGIGAPVVVGALVFFGALAAGKLDATVKLGSLAVTPVEIAILSGLGSLVVFGLFWLGGRIGFGPLAAPPAPDDPIRLLEPPGAPAEGWLRPGWLAGIPVVWTLVCVIALPLVVYVISYIPWAMIENHQLFPGWPPGHTGQTLLDLTGAMYNYHNSLTAAHPASSPWWAWPLNLKPVWFYQGSLAGGTSAALYDAGSLVIWWLGIPAIAFVSWMAFRRRSLALALVAIAFAAQWIPWARIDRAAFQYHYYTALPFVVMALAYFMAELWHGASRHTWALARIAGGLAIMGPALMWLLSRPICAFVGVDRVNPGSQACPAVIPDFTLTAQTAGLAIVLVIGLIVIIRGFLAFQTEERFDDGRTVATPALIRLFIAGLVIAFALGAASVLLPDTAILTLTDIPVEPIALDRRDPARLPGTPGVRLPRRPPVRRRVRGRGRRLVRDPVPEHQRPAAPGRGRRRLPGHPADLPVCLPVPGQHGHPRHERAGVHADAGAPADRPDRDLPGRRLLGLGLAARAGGGEGGERRVGRCGRPGPERRSLRHRGPEVGGQ